jgi:hypothetical protein
MVYQHHAALSGSEKEKFYFTFYSLRNRDSHVGYTNAHNKHTLTKIDDDANAECPDTSNDECLDQLEKIGDHHFKHFLLCQLDLFGHISSQQMQQWHNTDDQKWLKKLQKAYRKASLNHHPDKQSGKPKAARETAATRYESIAMAHEILSDEIKSGRFTTQQRQALDRSKEKFRASWNDFQERDRQKYAYVESSVITK